MCKSKCSVRLSLVLLCGALLFTSGCRSKQEKDQEALNKTEDSMNEAILRFIDEKDRSPKSLQELVSAGYLKEIPVDPVTGSNKTWLCLADEDDDSANAGIVDVSSSSESPDSDEGTYKSCL